MKLKSLYMKDFSFSLPIDVEQIARLEELGEFLVTMQRVVAKKYSIEGTNKFPIGKPDMGLVRCYDSILTERDFVGIYKCESLLDLSLWFVKRAAMLASAGEYSSRRVALNASILVWVSSKLGDDLEQAVQSIEAMVQFATGFSNGQFRYCHSRDIYV